MNPAATRDPGAPVSATSRPSAPVDASAADLGARTMVMNFGPQHPATHGTLRNILEVDGERILKITPDIGYLHTGFEKLGEHRTYNQFVTVTDRMNYISPLSNNIGFAVACEEMMGVPIPPRARVIRVILAELSRIADHVLCTGLQAMDLGAFSVMLWTFIEREKLYDIFERVTGTRLTTSYTRVGGLAHDVPSNFTDEVRTFVAKFPPLLAEVERMLDDNKIFRDRTIGIGAIPRDEAVSYGLTGPVLRATGEAWDVRKARPYLDYESYDFDVVAGADGDVWSRYKVRLGEMRESLKIVTQALERLAPGPVFADDRHFALPPKPLVYTKMEELIYHFKNVMIGHGIPSPPGEYYSSTEAPNGELGFYLISDGSDRPWRLRIRPPSFYNYQAVPRMMRGHMLPDMLSVLSSVNVIAGELDR